MSDDEAVDVEAELRAMPYEGERLAEVIRLGDAGVAVTSHRVLVLDPDGEPRFRAVALPNVLDAQPDTDGDASVALVALRRGVYAVALFAVSFLLDFEAMASDLLGLGSVPTGGTVAQVTSIVHSVVDALGVLDDLLGLAGLGFALVALVHAVRYARSRRRVLALSISGDDPIRIPIGRGETDAARRAAEAIERARESLR